MVKKRIQNVDSLADGPKSWPGLRPLQRAGQEYGRHLLRAGVVLPRHHRAQARGGNFKAERRALQGGSRTNDGIFLGNLSTHRILESNAAFQIMLGYTSEELRGMSLYEVIAENGESVEQNSRHIQEVGSIFIGERHYRRKDGSLVDVEVSAALIPYGEKEA